jgi:hypothetical protein
LLTSRSYDTGLLWGGTDGSDTFRSFIPTKSSTSACHIAAAAHTSRVPWLHSDGVDGHVTACTPSQHIHDSHDTYRWSHVADPTTPTRALRV